jgi:HEAT repeat protein
MMTLDDVFEDLTSGEDQVAEAAAQKIRASGSTALPRLKDLLRAQEPNVRWWAVRTLAQFENSKIAELLQSALQDPDLSVRQCAALALRHQPSAKAIPDLISFLGNEDQLLARLAGDALIANGENAVPALLEVMQNGPQLARLGAVRALALIGDQRSIPALFDALDSPSAIVEYWADQGLERMGVGMIFYKPGG